jgi:uncharacterized membrane protein YphA (DoxX/SURF4 family)/thiol-disulfide isomerase/thioredoxin
MDSIEVIARAVMFVVFALAGFAKVADLATSRETIEAFGLPKRMARLAGTALPLVELAVAAALLVRPTARWAAVAATLVLIVFSGGVAYALSQGRTPDCNCFGQVSSRQISWRTLVRNAVFVAVALFAAIAGPGSSLSSWTGNLGAANLVAALSLLIAVIATTIAYAYRNQMRALPDSAQFVEVADVLAPGVAAPDFALPSLDGDVLTRDALLARGLPMVLIFASLTCAPCRQLLPELARWNAAIRENVTLVVIESGVSDPAAAAEELSNLNGLQILVERDQAVAETYFVPGTPTGLAISQDGRVASPPLPGQRHIESLIRTVLRTGGSVPEAVAAQVPAATRA